MKRRLAGCLIVALALPGALAWAQRAARSKETAAETLKEKLDKGEKVLVIDVRTDDEVKAGSIPGAIHIPEDQLVARMKDIPKDVQLVFT